MPPDSLPAKMTYPITFKMEGPGLKQGIPIHEMTQAFGEFQAILDKSYLSLARKQRVSLEDRKHYSLVATNFKRGSLVADLQLWFIAGVPTLQGLHAVGLKPADIWEVTKQGYNFLRALLERRSKGEMPKVEIRGDNNLVNIIAGNGDISVHRAVYDAADRAEVHYKRMSRMIESGRIDTISSLDQGGSGIALGEADRALFNPQTRLEPTIHKIVGDIVRFDKISGKGKLHVPAGQTVPPGPYPFKALESGSRTNFIRSMMKNGVMMGVLRELAVQASGIEYVAALQVVTIHGDVIEPLFPPQLEKG